MEMRKLKYLIITIIVVINLFKYSTQEDDNWNHNERLRKKLLKGYDKMALPRRNENGTVQVLITMYVLSVWLDDDTQVMTVNSHLGQYWHDYRLTWDYKDYGGLRKAHFGNGEIWKPDIQVYNNAEGSDIDHYGNVHFLVLSSGTVIYVPPATMKVDCSMDITYWPFDEHTCVINLGSWTTHGWQLELHSSKGNETVDIPINDLKKSNWKVLRVTERLHTEYYTADYEPYYWFVYTFTLKRNSPSFEALTVAPAVVIPLLLLIQFLLPVDHPHRLLIGVTSSLFALFEMIFLKFSLPKVGTGAALIVTYYNQFFVVSILTVCLSSVLSRLSHAQNPLLDFAPPEIVKRILTGPLATVLCLQFHASKVGLSGNLAEDGEVLESAKSKSYHHEWLLIARVIDRIASILYICMMFLSLIIYVSPLK